MTRAIVLSTVFLLLMFSYQNCGKGYNAVENFSGSGSFSSTGAGGDGEGPAAIEDLTKPNLVPDCFTNPDYNACIVWKNPVAQIGQPLPQSLTSGTDLSDIQIHAVNIGDFNNSGELGNATIRVMAENDSGQLVAISSNRNEFKFAFQNDPNHRLSQVMSYFWLSAQEDLMLERTGAFYASGRSLQMIAHRPNLENAFWNPNAQQIVMGASAAGNEFGLSSEVYLHEMAHASLSFATNFAIHNTAGAGNVRTCNGGRCCTTINGCAGAINEGQADYHAGIMFPQNTFLLETFVNNPQGIGACGIPRAMEVAGNVSAQAAFDACGAANEGEIHATGVIYASVWWQVRLQAESQAPGVGAHEIDQLFTEHMPALNGSDDFVSARDKIIATDNALFAGKYSQLFRDEFERRGVQ